ncbi:MAG: hypothetical protein RLZZ618_3255 [Pseudomonadota bacterium]|jgi:hypothetical protein
MSAWLCAPAASRRALAAIAAFLAVLAMVSVDAAAQDRQLGAPLAGPRTIDGLSREPWQRTFASPVQSRPGETLYFERQGSEAVVWRLDWHSRLATPYALKALPLKEDLRYTVVVSDAGLWFIGPGILLVRPDGRVLQLPFQADEPLAVGLQDGSVLVLGEAKKNHTGQIRRLRFEAGAVVMDDKGVLPSGRTEQNKGYWSRYGVAAVALADGRVMAVGGAYAGEATQVDLIDPVSGRVQRAAPMPHQRSFAVLLRLPDGRVLAAGGQHFDCNEQAARSVDVYEPKTDIWRALPDMPLPLCADAAHATGPSGVVLPDGGVVLGGHLEQHLVLLRAVAGEPTGYAPAWELLGPLNRQRISGMVQALSSREVAVAGGIHGAEGTCCWGTPGGDLVQVPALPGVRTGTLSFGLGWGSPAVARRSHRVFVGGGHAHGTSWSAMSRPSTLAEMIDLRTGEVRQLPPLPFLSTGAQAAWLDDDRILVKGVVSKDSRGVSSSARFPQAGAFAVFSMKSARWGPVHQVAELTEASLVDAEGDDAYFASGGSTVLHLQLSTRRVKPLPRADLRQDNASVRRLAGGRIVMAGGLMQRQRMSVIDPVCEAGTFNPQRDCPERFTGWGALYPANRYQSYIPSTLPGEGRWQESGASAAWQAWRLAAPQGAGAPGTLWPIADSALDSSVVPGEVVQTEIDAGGRVLRLIRPPRDSAVQSLMFERSDPDGSRWHALPLPEELRKGQPAVCESGCRLLLTPRPDQAGEWLFLREGDLDDDRWWDASRRDPHLPVERVPQYSLARIWWWDEPGHRWHQVLQAPVDGLRDRPQRLGAPLSGSQGQVMSLGWHLPRPLLWTSP